MDGDDAWSTGVFAHHGRHHDDLHVARVKRRGAETLRALETRDIDDALTRRAGSVNQPRDRQHGVSSRRVLHPRNQAVRLVDVLDQTAGRFGAPLAIARTIAIADVRPNRIRGERKPKALAEFDSPGVVEAADQHDWTVAQILQPGRRRTADVERLSPRPQLARNERQRHSVHVSDRIGAKKLLNREVVDGARGLDWVGLIRNSRRIADAEEECVG